MSEGSSRDVHECALAALSQREHSRCELERKLSARGFAAAAIAATLDALGAAGLQDDRRFAAAYARQRAERGFGPRRIALELGRRGVPADLAGAALAALECDFEALACDVHRRKFRRAPATLAERARHTRFLEYRGFDTQQIRCAVGQTIDDEDL